MKRLFILIAATTLLFCSCNSGAGDRGDAVSIDNPTAENYFIIIDEDTLSLPAYTYIDNYMPICTGPENMTYPSGHAPGIHRYRVLDSNKKQLFDTTIQTHERFLFINPTRSTYVEWTVWYGDSIQGLRDSTYIIDSTEYTGQFVFYNSFVIENQCLHGLRCKRDIEGTQMIYRFEETEQYMPAVTSNINFLRWKDFESAYKNFSGPTQYEVAEATVHNLLREMLNNALDDHHNPFESGELQSLSGFIEREQYDKAVELVNVNSDYFEKHNPGAIDELNVQFTLYSGPPVGRLTPWFYDLRIVTYDLSDAGVPYVRQIETYDPLGDECTSEYFSMPSEDL